MRCLLMLACCAAVLAAGANAQQRPAWTVEVTGDALAFTGRIERGSVDEFLRALRAHPEVTRLVVTSGGGQVTSALEMGEAIHARQLDIDIPLRCLSSCANYLFPAARRKRLGHALAVGWHGNMTHVLYMQLTGAVDLDAQNREAVNWLAQREAEFFRRIGVDGFVCWLGKIAPYDVPNYYTLGAADMRRFGISDVEVRDAPSPAPDGDTPVLLTVDFDRLARTRPAMPLP